MSSPFSFFRSNQHLLMVAIVILAMLAFTLDTVFSQQGAQFVMLGVLLGGMIFGFAGISTGRWMQYGIGGAILGAVCGWVLPEVISPASEFSRTSTLGTFDSRRFSQLMLQRNIANSFLQQSFEKTIGPGMGRFAPQFQFDAASIGDTEDDLMFGEFMRAEADELGIAVTDSMVSDYINRMTQEKLSAKDFAAIRTNMNFGGNPVSEEELFNAFRQEIKALIAFQHLRPVLAGIPQGPEFYYELFRRTRVNQRLNTVRLDVDAFLSEVGEPSEADIATLFADYRLKFPGMDEPGSPGFRQPPKAKLGYIEVSYKSIEGSVEPPTDAEVEAYYNANKDSLYRKPAEPGPEETKPADPQPSDAKPDGEMPADPPASAPADPSASNPTPDTPAPDAPAPDAPKPDAAKEDATPDAEPKVEEPKPAEDEKPAEEPKPAEPKPEEPSPAEEPKPAEPAPAETPEGEAPKADETPKVEEPSAPEAPAEAPQARRQLLSREAIVTSLIVPQEPESPQDAAPVESATPAAQEEPAAAPEAAASTQGAPADQPAKAPAAAQETEKPEATPEGDAKPADAASQTPETPAKPEVPGTPAAGATDLPQFVIPPVEYRPLDDDLKSEIRDRLLDEKVRKTIDETMKAILADLRTLEKERSSARRKIVDNNPEIEEPALFEKMREHVQPMIDGMMATAKKHGGVYVETPFLTLDELYDGEAYPVGAATDPSDNPFMQSGPNVAQQVFQVFPSTPGDDTNLFSRNHSVKNAFDLDGGESHFAWWTMDYAASHVPRLDDPGIRDQVVLTWKRMKARDVAKKRAEELAALVREGLKKPEGERQDMAASLEGQTVLGKPDSPAVAVRQTQPFSWMEQSMTPQMNFNQRPQIRRSAIRFADEAGGSIRYAGERFMKAVFNDIDNEDVGVVADDNFSSYYVVHPVERTADDDVLRQQFMTEGKFGFRSGSVGTLLSSAVAVPASMEWEKSIWAKYGVDRDSLPEE
jgi:hypothetical protein